MLLQDTHAQQTGPPSKTFYTFKTNPKLFSLLRALEDGQRQFFWLSKHTKYTKPDNSQTPVVGDRVLLYVAGREGYVAIATIEDERCTREPLWCSQYYAQQSCESESSEGSLSSGPSSAGCEYDELSPLSPSTPSTEHMRFVLRVDNYPIEAELAEELRQLLWVSLGLPEDTGIFRRYMGASIVRHSHPKQRAQIIDLLNKHLPAIPSSAQRQVGVCLYCWTHMSPEASSADYDAEYTTLCPRHKQELDAAIAAEQQRVKTTARPQTGRGNGALRSLTPLMMS
mmetsp:Transcript_31551/g.70218  ORF Transcript_31551/g.70218 Transcript_31551/m.70218 type:complete len:283 (+) Transcript_31551:60-908(+)